MLHKTLDPYEIANNSFSVLFDSLAPARLALRANRVALPQRLPAFSVVSFDSLRSLLRSCLRQSNSRWSVVVKSAEIGLIAKHGYLTSWSAVGTGIASMTVVTCVSMTTSSTDVCFLICPFLEMTWLDAVWRVFAVPAR